jgi:hypothetical protein
MPQSISKLRVAITMLITFCVLYFIVGGLLTVFKLIQPATYAIIGGIVGGFASVLGLLSLARPPLSQSDINQIEIDSLKKITEASEEIKTLEKTRAATEQELDTLEERKRQMEFLVQKASLSLFLQEQGKLYEKRIQEQLSNNKELAFQLSELSTIDTKLDALNEEIDRDPNVNILKGIIESVKKEPTEDFADYPPLLRILLILSKELMRMKQKVLRI